MTQQTAGIIGLGIMGGAMARNLKAAGWDVFGFDTAQDRRDALSADGINIAQNTAELVSKTRYIVTSLPNAQALMITAQAIADSEAKNCIIAEVSTLSLADKAAARDILEQAGHILLDCPVSGTGAQARAKDLVVYASGAPEAIEEMIPLFDCIGRETHNVGAFGDGSRMKFIANHLVTINNVATAEAIVLAMKAGLDPHKVVEVVGSGIGTSRIFNVRAPFMADNSYQPPTAHLSIADKDISIISKFIEELHCPTPMFNASKPIYAAAMAHGHAKDDPAAVCAILEEMAGIKR